MAYVSARYPEVLFPSWHRSGSFPTALSPRSSGCRCALSAASRQMPAYRYHLPAQTVAASCRGSTGAIASCHDANDASAPDAKSRWRQNTVTAIVLCLPPARRGINTFSFNQLPGAPSSSRLPVFPKLALMLAKKQTRRQKTSRFSQCIYVIRQHIA